MLGSDRPQSRFHRDDLIRMLPTTLQGNRSAGLVKEDIRSMDGSGKGYYSWLFERMLGDSSVGNTHIGRFENLKNDFHGIMTRLVVDEAQAMREAFDARERKNASRHTHYSHYYDDELEASIARNEATLIERFDYAFERVKPEGAVYDFPGDLYDAASGFKKLLGREKHFLKLHDRIDVDVIREKLEQVPEARWKESERERLFDVHRDTHALLLVHFEDVKFKEPEYRALYSEFGDLLQPVIDYISSYYRDNGFVVRILFARLVAGGKIPQHTDAGYSLLNGHRVHIPIITNDQVDFHVGEELINMRVGELWEINNGTMHSVRNRGDKDRVHLIIDWMPNENGNPIEEVLTPADPADIAAEMEIELNSMIAQAHRQHRAGNVDKAESLYRQVLHFDDTHVVANNLLGLLYLQTKRANEAADHIRKALAVMPDDAQAHSNLALALNDVGLQGEAEKAFLKSLELNPNNPRVYNNLGGVYITIGRINDAISCFEHALALFPNSAEIHFNLGNALMHLKRFDDAIPSFERCLALQPDFGPGLELLKRAKHGRNEKLPAKGR